MISRVLGQPFIDGAYWTIACELIFYGWVALGLATGLLTSRWRMILATWLMSSVVNETIWLNEVLRKCLLTEFSAFFAFGMALYRLRRGHRDAVPVLLLSAAWAPLAVIMLERNHPDAVGTSPSTAALAIAAVACLALVAAATIIPLGRRIGPLATAVGALTYPFYLLHQHAGYAIFANFASEDTR
jgi:peptidoglycan/LPS O-acetylase OafA/YrhL